MDQERFDRITRTLASGQSRRGLLKGLTGTAIGGLLATVGIAEASARGACREPGCSKGKNAVCSSYAGSCSDITGVCTPDGYILRATCETGQTDEVSGQPVRMATSLNVNTCKSESYVVSNCSGVLTCGSCGV
jgi:hypothetical protein